MIPMTCPSCGRRGTVPPDRLNTRMHCKKCDAVFHMDPSGKIVLGDPNDPRGKGGISAATAAAARAKKKKRDPIELGLGGMIAALPKPVKIGVVGLALVAVLFVFVVPRINRMLSGGKVPSGLDARTNYVINAFADENYGKIAKVAAPGTEDALRQWYDKTRPLLKFKGPQKQGNMIIPQPLAVTNAGGVAEISLRMMTPGASELPEVAEAKEAKPSKRTLVAGYNGDGTFDLPSYWVIDANNEAFLDGQKSLEYITNPDTGSSADDKKKK